MSRLRRVTQPLILLVLSLIISCPAFAQQDLTVSSNTTLTTGTFTYDDVTVSNSANLTLEGTVRIIANNITVQSGSKITADKKGYAALQGPGAGAYLAQGGSGAGHGGDGGRSSTLPVEGKWYGSATHPIEMGSGGGGTSCTINSVTVNSGGRGGGAIRLDVANTLTVSGTISSNGGDGSEFTCDFQSGGGAGGSIYITTDTFAGAGDIVANGGHGGLTLLRGGGGGGGRIAVYYESSTFSGSATALGGFGKTESGVSGSGDDGTVGFFDTSNNTFLAGHDWRFQFDDQPFGFNTMMLDDGSLTTSEGTITITGTQLIVGGNSTLILSDFDSLNIKDVTVTGSSSIEGNLLLQANNLIIESGSKVLADKYGLKGGMGAGAGLPNQGQGGGGGGYGGEGGTSLGGIAYGSPTAPVDLGSGGAGPGFGSVPSSGGPGGGKIQLSITDTLTVNGILSANGGNGLPQGSQAGGGSGGSIYVITENFTGSGSISSMGGDSGPTGGAAAGGGGGGGRIAIYHRQTETYSGSASVVGGNGVGEDGEDGTLIITQNELMLHPDEGGDNGFVTVAISGSAFSEGVTVKFSKSGESDIIGSVLRIEESFTSMLVRFDLNDKDQGQWDLIVDNGGDTTPVELEEVFDIVEGKDSKIWVDIIGLNAMRPNRAQKFYIVYGNSGNTDAQGAQIAITGLPLAAEISTDFDYIISPLNLEEEISDAPLAYFASETDKTIEFHLMTIPAGFTGVLGLQLTVPESTNFQLKPIVIDP